MAITSIGYAGTVNTTQWAALARDLGKTYGIVSIDHFATTIVTGDRNVSVSAGVAYGMGIKDTKVGSDIVQMPPISSGTRYDMVVIRRTWATGVTSLAVVQGTSSRVLPLSPHNTPGAVDDQPIALVRVQAGMSAPQEVIDLRCWAGTGGALVTRDELALQYLGGLGAHIRIGAHTWHHGLNGSGVPSWYKNEDPLVPNSQGFQMYATGTGLVGSYDGSGWKMQAGTIAGYTDALGWIRVTFPKPFPGGVQTFQVMNGDGVQHNLVFEVAGSPFSPYGPSQRREDFVLRVWRNGSTLNGAHIRLNWFAIGW